MRTPRLVELLAAFFEKGVGPRAARAAVAKQASYGTVHAIYREWRASRSAPAVAAAPEPPAESSLSFTAASGVEAPPLAPA